MSWTRLSSKSYGQIVGSCENWYHKIKDFLTFWGSVITYTLKLSSLKLVNYQHEPYKCYVTINIPGVAAVYRTVNQKFDERRINLLKSKRLANFSRKMSVPWSYVMKSIMLLIYRITKRSASASKLHVELTVYQKLIRENTVCREIYQLPDRSQAFLHTTELLPEISDENEDHVSVDALVGRKWTNGVTCSFRTHNPSVARHHHFPPSPACHLISLNQQSEGYLLYKHCLDIEAWNKHLWKSFQGFQCYVKGKIINREDNYLTA
jgi:hypothetical protein